jgi:hypothetical protein
MSENVIELLPFCQTDRQRKVIEAVAEHGSQRKTAKALGVNKNAVAQIIAAVSGYAAKRGHSPKHDMTRTVPEGYQVKGVSTYYNKEGKPSGQWVKSQIDAEKQAALMKEMVEALCADISPLKPVKAPDKVHCELLNVIPMGDPHFGLYAWAKESGSDFNADEAKRLTLGAVDRLLASAPDAATCIVLPLGDIFHANDQSNATPAHHHQLDVDTRYQRVMMIGVLTFRYVITKALEKHQNVVVRFVKGNHDPEASFGLAIATASFFHENPRVTVDLSPSDFWYYQHGKTLIGATHGDKVKHEQLGGVMAADQAEKWGTSKHRYWLTGHVHSQQVRELPGCVCESFRTLAAKDAYASGHGYRAGRDMRCITYHTDHGEVERHRCDVGMLDA